MSQTTPPQPISRKDMMAPHRIMRLAIIVICVAVFAAAVVWEVLRVTTAPALMIISPADNTLTASHRITLEGRAASGAAITANGVKVAASVDGHFKEDMDLRTGANVITIVASKKFAKPNIIYRRVVVTAE
jgi:hypothetical protein